METFSYRLPEIFSMNILKNIDPKGKTFTRDLLAFPQAGRMSHFSKEWEILTKHKEIF